MLLSHFQHGPRQEFSGNHGAITGNHCCKLRTAARMCVTNTLGVAPGTYAHAPAGESQHWSWKQPCYLQHAPLSAQINTPEKTGLARRGEVLCWCPFPSCWYLQILQLGYPPAARHGKGQVYLQHWGQSCTVF